MTAADDTGSDWFGHSVFILGNTALIGAALDDDNGNNSGSAYVFTRDATSIWAQQAKLLASDGGADNEFGKSVALSDDTALVGADNDDDRGDASGSAYVFTRDASGIWTQQAKLTASDGKADQYFGNSVSLSEDTVLIGATGSILGDSLVGSAYVFTRDASGIWTQQARIVPFDSAVDDGFGISVSLSGDMMLIGSGSEAAYLFTLGSDGVWVQQTKVITTDDAAEHYFSSDVSLLGNVALIGDFGNDTNGTASGAVYWLGPQWWLR